MDGTRQVATMNAVQATLLTPLVEIVRAASGAVDRTAFLPLAARETGRLLGAEACEIWLDEDGVPVLSAVHRSPSSVRPSPGRATLSSTSVDGAVEVDGWVCAPLAGESNVSGFLTVARAAPWEPAEVRLVELVAGVIALGLRAAEAGRFDDEARNEFLALVGHDLRSPLSNVKVGAQLARRNLDAGDLESVGQALQIIENQSARLLARLEALLDAVAASGRWLIRLEPLDLVAMAESATAPYRMAEAESGTNTTFEVVANGDVPMARGDAGQIAQVIEHLVDNAAKYASGGHITVSVSLAGSSVRMDVCDTGPGIRPEDVERVFAPFGRGRSAASKDGYGLGLYLARNIVVAHGGKLWIARTSRSGTCMAFTLPVRGSEEA